MIHNILLELKLFFYLIIVKCCVCERRIINGLPVKIDKPYMVYLLQAAESTKNYSGWLCGGAIVHPRYVLTASACLWDVNHLYVISGYRKYVPREDVDKNPCTKRIKKKIIYACAHKDFYTQAESIAWCYGDIGLARVDTPFNPRDESYVKYCSYPPAPIEISYSDLYERPGTDAITLGWGHDKFYRPVGDFNDYNEKYLRYASTIIMEKEECKRFFTHQTPFYNHIIRYNICAYYKGNLDENGKLIVPYGNLSDECDKNKLRSGNETCDENYFTRRNLEVNINDGSFNYVTRRDGHGFCQNDHGGPLVTWIGGREYVIGVATSFLVAQNMECSGPFSYSSTHCRGRFLQCILDGASRRRDTSCDEEAKRLGFQFDEKDISWPDEPDSIQKDVEENDTDLSDLEEIIGSN